jgi:hypothetical protein
VGLCLLMGPRGERGCTAGLSGQRCRSGCRLRGLRSRLGRGLGLWLLVLVGQGRRRRVPFEPRSWVRGLDGNAMFVSVSSSYYHCRYIDVESLLLGSVNSFNIDIQNSSLKYERRWQKID